MDKREVKLDIDNGDAFYADEAGVMHNPLKVILDFRSMTPRMDVRAKDFQPLVLKHNVVVMEPFIAKHFAKILTDNIKNYEKKFGKIEKPKALEMFEKMAKEPANKKSKKDMPSYFG